ncbi:MAG: SBBP repeat-containing protein, partial [Bacteroidota bacterium]
MQKKILPLFFLLCTCLLNAQDAGLNWATGTGSSAVDEGRAITSDVNGNVYTVGHFEGSADFDPGLGSLVLTSAGIGDVFVQKLDADGNLLWARRVGGSRNERANAVSVDGSGNVYVTGSFEETVDFDPGMGMEELTATDGAHVYVLKLDANGDFVWAKDIVSRGTGLGIAATADGSVYVTGGFQQPLSIDGSTIFVQRLDASGAMSWEAIMGGTSVDEGTGVAVDGSGNAYVTGRFSTTVDFDPGMTELNITAEGGQDVFVQKFSPSGGMLWVRTFGGDGVDWARGIAVDADDNAYVTGSFQQTVDFDPGAGTTELTSSDFENMFVHKLDEMGAFVWVRQNEGLCTGESIAVGNNG